ncbi:MAG: hypothetical protein V4633_04620 [Pseudomonadota bacterium]
MHVEQFGTFRNSFGLIKGRCQLIAQDFQDWQNGFLSQYGFHLSESTISGPIDDALKKLSPRTAPISTSYLFWPLNEEWTLYFDNGRLGTDASPPSVLASRLHTAGIRVSLANELVEPGTGRVLQYGATIFEYFENSEARRFIYAVNDGGRWVFNQGGTPFDFETTETYKSRLVRDRFSASTLLGYLNKLNASLDETSESKNEYGPGRLIVKTGKMPRDFIEFHE